jgi:kynurenine formamidase
MKKLSSLIALAVLGAAGLGAMLAQAADAPPVSDKPFEEKWFPTEWGADDKAGAINRITPEYVMKVMKLVKTGKSTTLGKVYSRDIPGFGVRAWQMSIPGTPTGGPFGKNALVYHDEMLTTEIGQIGTQFDGPGHIGVHTSKGNMMYNGRLAENCYMRGAGGRVLGMGDCGVEHVAQKAYICRGILIDAKTYKGGGNPLPIPQKKGDPGIVTAADIQDILKKEGVAEPGEGDCVFLYTGHGDLWGVGDWEKLSDDEKAARRKTFASGEPGYGISACQWMASKKIAHMGGDTSANDAQPGGEEEGFAVPCHTEMQTRRGIWNLENMDLTVLAKEKVYEFLYVWSPLKMRGATGSPANPVAIW